MAESSTLIQHHAQFSGMRPEFADKSIENGLKKGWITQKDIALIREFVTEKKVSGCIGLSVVL